VEKEGEERGNGEGGAKTEKEEGAPRGHHHHR